MNVSLLLDKSFQTLLEEDLKYFFQINIGSTKHIGTVWEASKAYIRGKLIAYASKRKKESLNKIQILEKEIKYKENLLSGVYTEQLYRDICGLKFQLNEIYNKKVAYSMLRLNSTFYEGGEKTGKVLARQVKKQDFSNFIPAIKHENNLVISIREINRIFMNYYKSLYTSTVSGNQTGEDLFLCKLDLPNCNGIKWNGSRVRLLRQKSERQ